jgi:hypothetical protein
MRYISYGLAIALMIAISTTGASAQTSQSTNPSESTKDKVSVDEKALDSLVGEAEHYFHQAREDFFKKNMKAAADEMRKGAAFMKLEAGRATEAGKKPLMDSIQELEELADSVEKGTVTSTSELGHAFARAHTALATHYRLKAAESWATKETSKAGKALKAAALHLEYSAAWGSVKLETGTKEVVKNTRILAEKLMKGTGSVTTEVGKTVEALGKEIKKVGQSVEPQKKM